MVLIHCEQVCRTRDDAGSGYAPIPHLVSLVSVNPLIALELARYNITVNAFAAGAIESQMRKFTSFFVFSAKF